MEDKVLLIAAYHHIIAVTQVLCRNILQTIQSFTSQMNGAARISYASSPLHPYWLWVQTASYKKWIHVVFSQGVYQSELEAGKLLV
jgi:hypothetical protein